MIKNCFLVSSFLFTFCILAQAQTVSEGNAEIHQILNSLEVNMQKINTMQTAFTQTKHLNMFTQPVVLSGLIYMQKPEQFAWYTKSPIRYSMVFEKDKIYQWSEDADRVEAFSFAKMPVIRLVFEQMQACFNGSYTKLLDDYAAQVESREPLVLKFTPRENGLLFGIIQSITVRFKGDRSYLESIRTEEKNGDYSEMNFTNTILNAKIDAAVWKLKSRAA